MIYCTHVLFDRFDKKDYPTEIAFDIDPMAEDFAAAREVALELKNVLDTKFVADILIKKIPDLITLERLVKNRANKVYFDYLQLLR